MLDSVQIIEAACANNLARLPVSYPQNQITTTLVSERDTVTEQLLMIKIFPSLLELKMLVLWPTNRVTQLLLCGDGLKLNQWGSSARANRLLRLN